MSECVVRMEMPKGCYYCPMARVTAKEWWCLAFDSLTSVDGAAPMEKRPGWCPIICQLPEGHGRLIDADALKDYFVAEAASYDLTQGQMGILSEAIDMIDEQPTIVPADTAESPSPNPSDPLPIRGVEYVPTEVDVQTGTVTYELRERSET